MSAVTACHWCDRALGEHDLGAMHPHCAAAWLASGSAGGEVLDAPTTRSTPDEAISIVSLDEFVAVDEPGAEPLLGDMEANLVPENADIMAYGDGGAGKSTLMFDCGFHLAAGDPWLDIPIPRRVRVLIVENEGPRSMLRKKLKRKREAWGGSPLGDRVQVFEGPWREFTVGEQAWRDNIAGTIEVAQIDVLIAGPLVTIGMDTHGTLQEVRAFIEWIQDVRRRSRRPLTVVLIHHENKSGDVSGAWTGALDTMLHVQNAGNGHTVVYVKKARWDSSRHGTTMNLAWQGVDGFRLEGDRDYLAEITALLDGGKWLSVREIATGIEAGEQTVKPLLVDNPGRFELRSGDAAKALGRSHNAKLFGLRSTSNVVNVDPALWGASEVAETSTPLDAPLKGAERSGVDGRETEATDKVYVQAPTETDQERADRLSERWLDDGGDR
jgi:hypothetical protein